MSAQPALLALLGFTLFERGSFEAFFALGREQGPGYALTRDLWRAECAVVDADNDEAVARLMHAGLLERSLLLGSTPHAGAALQLPRPINLLLVMRVLDTIVGARPRAATRLATSPDDTPARKLTTRQRTIASADETAATAVPGTEPTARNTRTTHTARTSHAEHTEHTEPTEPTEPTLPTSRTPTRPPWERPPHSEDHVQRVLDELAFRTAPLPPNLDMRALAAEGAPSARRSAAALERADLSLASTRRAVLPMEHILVIDNDAATLRLVAVQLQRFGFQMHLAGHPDDALRLLISRFHDYVFMDPALPGLDALLVCRLARQIPPPDERAATTVVLLADPNDPAAPLERALPAADACLRKPLDQRALLKLMGEREFARVAYEDTARTTTLI